jgi:hypothetical protein
MVQNVKEQYQIIQEQICIYFKQIHRNYQFFYLTMILKTDQLNIH